MFPPNEAGALFNFGFNGASSIFTKVSTDLKIFIIEVLRDNGRNLNLPKTAMTISFRSRDFVEIKQESEIDLQFKINHAISKTG